MATALVAFKVAGERRGQGRLALLEPESPARREAGRKIYAQHCGGCHGARLTGAEGWQQTPGLPSALDNSGHASRHSDLELFNRVSRGARAPDGAVAMPAFRALLSADEIVSVLSYVVSQWPAEVVAQRRDPDWTFPGECIPNVPPS